MKLRVLNEDISNFHHWRKTVLPFTADTGIEVELEYQWLNVYWQTIIDAYTVRAGDFDVIATDEMLLPIYARRGAVTPLDDLIARDNFDLSSFNPAALDCVTVDGKIYGIPYSNMSNVLSYRADLLEKYGFAPPRTLDELMSTAIGIRSALKKDGKEDVYGLITRGKAGAGANMWIFGSTIAPAFGANWFKPNGESNFDSVEWINALEYYSVLLRESAPPDSAEIDWYNGAERYFDGEAAMYIEAASEVANWYERKPKISELTKVTLIPSGAGGDRHAGMYAPAWNIPSSSKYPEEAWEFIKWAASPEPAAIDLASGHLEQARLSALVDARAKESYTSDLVDTVITTKSFSKNERPVIDDWLEVGDVIGNAVSEVLVGKATPKEAMKNAQREICALRGR